MTTFTIENHEHAGRIALHVGRQHGARFATGTTVRATSDVRVLLEQVAELRAHASSFTLSPQGAALDQYSRALEAELLAHDERAKEAADDVH